MNLIPDGPLHPEIALAAGIIGVTVSALSFRARPGHDPSAALAGAAVAFVSVPIAMGEAPWDLAPYMSSDARLATLLFALVGAVLLAAVALVSAHASLAAALVTICIAWGTVPDTEWPLALAFAVGPAALLALVRPWRSDRWSSLAMVVLGGAVGTASGFGARGRVERIWYPALTLVGAAVLAGLLGGLWRWWSLRRR